MILQRLLSFLGVDRSIGLTLLNRGWVAIAGPLSLIFIVRNLTAVEQGFYFTITSILGLQVFFELGLGFVLLQTTSHLMGKLSLRGDTLVGDQATLERLGRLFVDMLRWYAVIAVAFVVVVATAGMLLLARHATAEPVAWQTPWMLLVPVFGASIVINAVFSMLEGLGLVAEVAKVRLVQSLLAMAGLWIGLTAGWQLAALVMMHAANVAVALAFLLIRHHRLLVQLYKARGPRGAIDWKRDIWPFQWRIAVSWTAGYLGTQALTPIVFQQMGPVAAGQVGLSLALMGAVSAMAMAWVTTKSPTFGRLVAQKRYVELAALYKHAESRAMVAAIAVTALLVVMAMALGQYWPDVASRFVTTVGIALLAAATVFNVQISARAVYLRGFRREPFMALSVCSGACIAALTFVTATVSGTTTAVVACYAGIAVCVALMWAGPLFRRCQGEFTKA
jgi:hypothetical protein